MTYRFGLPTISICIQVLCVLSIRSTKHQINVMIVSNSFYFIGGAILNEYRIKELTPSDIDEFSRVRQNALEQFPVAYSMMADLYRKAPLDVKLAQLESANDKSANFTNGIFIGDKLIGTVGFLINKRGSVAHKGTMWGFYVDPEYQSKGYGRKLLKSYIEKIKNLKEIKQHRLMVSVSCENAIKLFESAGFTKYGQEPCSISDGENYFDQAYYFMMNNF